MSKIEKIKQEINYYRALAKDQRTPKIAKWFLAGAIAYFMMPIDIIPDFIPMLGQIDDLLIVPALIWLGLKLIPKELKKEVRERVAGVKAH